MPTHNTTAQLPPRNPIPGPAERAALQPPLASPRTGDAGYRPPTRTATRLQTSPRNPASHPLVANLKERRDEQRMVTPAIARVLLEQWNRRNRTFREDQCSRYTTDMEENHFDAENGATIGIDWNGDLTDGQHRLTAIVRTGRTYPLLICSGLDPKARDTVDIGTTRTLGQILALNGVEHAETVGRAARLLIAYDEGSFEYTLPGIRAQFQPTKAQAEVYIAAHSTELQQAARQAAEKRYRNRWFTAGLTCFFLVLFGRQNPDLAKLFLYQLGSGLQNPEDGGGLPASSPVYQLRERLLDNQTSVRKFYMSHLIGMTLKVWVAVRDHKTIRLLAVRKDERFPDIDEGWKPDAAKAKA